MAADASFAPKEKNPDSDKPRMSEGILSGVLKKTRLGPFERLGLSPRTCLAVKKLGFSLPTPIQRKAIPAILSGSGDVIAMARTGSGKTAAFLLPLIDRLDCHCRIVGVRGLVVSPTRELALQTYHVCRKLLFGTDLRLCSLVGGVSMQEQFSQLANNPDIIIATPGRLVHHIVEADLSLTRVEMAIFDEADQLWELNLVEDVNKIMKGLKLATKQCILMSATIPQQLAEFASVKFNNPTFIQLDADKMLSEKLTLDFFYCRQHDKLAALLFWITHVKEEAAKLLVFVSTVHHARFLAEMLRSQHIDCAIISGTMTIAQRTQAMQHFKEGKCKILLSTDVAAKGVDIAKLEYVFNYDFPPSAKWFVHRCGRTARKNESGTAVSLVTKDDLPFVIELLLFLGRRFRIENQKEDHQLLANGMSLALEESISSRASDDLELAGFPDLDAERQLVADELRENAELARLHESCKGGQLKHHSRRIPASKISIRKAGELINTFGGSEVLADTVHSKLKAIHERITAAAKKAKETLNSSFFDALNKEAGVTVSVNPRAYVDTSTIREYRPTQSASSLRGMGVGKELVDGVQSIIVSRKLVSELASRGLKDLDGKTEDLLSTGEDEGLDHHEEERDDDAATEKVQTDVTSKKKVSRAERRKRKSGKSEEAQSSKKHRVEEDYFLSAVHDEASYQLAEELKLNAKMQLEREALDIIDEDTGGRVVRKVNRSVMKWDPIKKKYMVTQIDREGKRIKQKDSSGTIVRGDYEKKGIYKKWLRHSEQRIQRSGEAEDESNVNLKSNIRGRREKIDETEDALEPMPLESITRDLGLLEKVKTNRKLTHKEARKYQRIQKLARSPITRGASSKGRFSTARRGPRESSDKGRKRRRSHRT